MSDTFFKGKKILVTGANGFLGSHLSVELFKRGAIVIGLIKEKLDSSFLDFSWKELKKPKIKIVKSDIVDFRSMLKIFKKCKPDICMHVAAQPIVGIANKTPIPTFLANIEGTWNILEVSRICNVKAVVVASSDKAYGDHEKLPYKEEAKLKALNPYDVSKACTDILARCYAHTYNLNTGITRCANIYGQGDFNFSRIVPDTIRAIVLNKRPIIRSDGTPVRDYIYVKDVIKAYLVLAKKLYKREIKAGEAFNFGTGKPISVLSLVNKMLKMTGKENVQPKILSKVKIKGEIDKQYLSSKKAKDVLGWKAKYTLNEGIKETCRWYKTHL